MNIFLMGPRGCGKSTIGRGLAAVMSLPFIDLDQRVLANFTQPTVRGVWWVHGEAAWRAAEAAALEELLSRVDQVVALGGGTPMIEPARKRLEQERRAGRAVLVYLRCAVEELKRRLAADTGDRPPLTAGDPDSEIAVILAQREPAYRAIADLELDVTASSPQRAVEALRRRLRRPATPG